MKERTFALQTLGGGVRSTRLTYSALRALRPADVAA